MHVILTGFSPTLQQRLVAALGPATSHDVVPPTRASVARPCTLVALGDDLDAAARRDLCVGLRAASAPGGGAVVLVADLDPAAQALARDGLVDAVIDPADSDDRMSTRLHLAATRAARVTHETDVQPQVLRAVADTAPVLLWMCDERGQCTFANSAYLAFVGAPFEALRGDGWKNFVHPDDRTAVDPPWADAIKTHQANDQIVRVRRHDGEWRWILDQSVPWHRADGAFGGFVGSCTDISELRQAEQDSGIARDLAVRFAHAATIDEVLPACLEAALEVSHYDNGGIYLREPDGSLRLAETRNVSDALRETLTFIRPGSDRMRIVERGEPVFSDYRSLLLDLNPVAIAEGVRRIAMLPLHHQDEVIGLLMLGSTRQGDVAEGRRRQLEAIAAQMSTALASLQAEDALARSERLLRAVVAHAPIAIWTLRQDVSVGDVWNPAAERLFGLRHEEVAGLPCPVCAPAPGESAPPNALARLFEARTLEGEHVQRMRPDGSLVEILLYATPLRSRTSEITAAVAIGVDMTERKQIEARLMQAQKQESLGALAGGLAHDFNNLLTGILGYLDLAREDMGDANHPVIELIDLAQDSARRATSVTRQMLAFSGRGKFVIETLDLAGVVSQTVPMLTAALRKRALVTELEADLPPVEGDVGQLRQMLINLVTNAAESLVDAAGVVRVGVRAQTLALSLPAVSVDEEEVPPGDYVVLTVADTGSGIDDRIRGRIFDPFFSTKFVGRGLGLSAVLGIVRGHHGHIRIDSAPGRGTLVRVFLPATAKEDDEMLTPLEPVPDAARRRVLFVDDEPGVLYVASQALMRAGFDVLTAATGREALARVGERTDDIGLVILDLTMPDMDGRATLAELRKLRPSLRVVLTSGYSEQDALREFGDGTLAGFLQKPFAPHTLIDCVTRAIGLPEAP